MADMLDFRHPDHLTLEQSLHAPPPDMETYVDDLNASQVSVQGHAFALHKEPSSHFAGISQASI